MSLLMEALKQQQVGPIGTPPTPVATGQGWKVLALVLLVVVGLMAGFLIASWLQQPAAVITSPPPPASTGQILTELLAVPAVLEKEVEEETIPEDPQILVSAGKPARQGKRGGQTLEQQVQTIETGDNAEQSFAEQPQMAEADVDEPVTDLVVKPPELTTADVSDELRTKFALALEQSDPLPRHQSVTDHAAPARDIQTLDELLKRQIPPLRFEAHVYASEPKQRWVKVNGKDLQEGQWITADIQLKEITPQYVLLQTGRQMFSMEALTEWSYRLPNP